MSNEVSAKAIRDLLAATGRSHADLAREIGVPRATVRGILYGHLKGTRGDAHKVAVALGLKDGVIVDDGVPLAEAIKAMRAA